MVPNVGLNNAVLMPQLGLGVFRVPDAETTEVVTTALEAGYRHVDTAAVYENERGVGAAIKDLRDEVFLTTKVWNTNQGYDATMRAFEASTDRLGTDYLDLYLIHWPAPSRGTYPDTWRALQDLYADGRVRAIGVSNFTEEHLRHLLENFDIIPTVNQIELHPYLSQAEMRGFHQEHRIATEAWAPLAKGRDLLSDPVLEKLAGAYGKTPAQIVIRWHLQLGNVVIPKSVTPSRIRENIDVFDFELAEDDMVAVSGLNRNHRMGPNPDEFS